MILPSFHLIFKQYHNHWRSSLFRKIVVINQRQLSIKQQYKNDSKQQENKILVKSSNNQIEIITFTQKGIEYLFILFYFCYSNYIPQLNKLLKILFIHLLSYLE